MGVTSVGTQKPHEVWIAIPHKARAPAFGKLPVRITRFSGAALTYGVVDTEFEGVPAKITTPDRTVVDCFRFRSKIGLEPALEALHDVLDDGKATPGQIRRAAEFRFRLGAGSWRHTGRRWAHSNRCMCPKIWQLLCGYCIG